MFSNPCARRRVAWAIAFVCAMPHALHAAQQPMQPAATALERAPLPIADAVRRAWRQSAAMQAVDAKVAAADARERAAARPLYNPELELAIENADVDTRSVGISQTIDWSDKRRARTTAASAEARALQAERDQVRQRIALQWLAGLATFSSASEQTDLGARRVALLQQFATLAERRFAAGDIARVESDLAQLALQEALVRQAELRADQAKARQTLAIVEDDMAGLPELPRALPPAASVPLDPARIESLPLLRQASADMEAADAKVSVAERERRADPTISLLGGRVTNGPISDKVIGINLRIPLFVRNDYSAEVAAARATADEGAANVRDRRRQAVAEAEQAGASYNTLRDAWLAFAASRVGSTDERAALLQRLWEAGELGTSDYLVQLDQGIDTELAATALRARVWQAFADWLGASGELDRWMGIEGARTETGNPE